MPGVTSGSPAVVVVVSLEVVIAVALDTDVWLDIVAAVPVSAPPPVRIQKAAQLQFF